MKEQLKYKRMAILKYERIAAKVLKYKRMAAEALKYKRIAGV